MLGRENEHQLRANRTDTRQPAHFYVARRREDRDVAKVVACTFTINFV